MRLHRLDADMQLFPDILVALAFGDEQQHLPFTLGQTRRIILNRPLADAAGQRLGHVPGHHRHAAVSPLERVDQFLSRDRLEHIADSSRFNGVNDKIIL
ncbi:hypothetical protein D3C71_1555620 [compost metagenome]